MGNPNIASAIENFRGKTHFWHIDPKNLHKTRSKNFAKDWLSSPSDSSCFFTPGGELLSKTIRCPMGPEGLNIADTQFRDFRLPIKNRIFHCFSLFPAFIGFQPWGIQW